MTLPGLAGCRLDRIAGRALRFAVFQVGEPLGQGLEVGPGVDPEDEPGAVPVPAVQVPGPGEVGVPPVGDLAEPGPAAQGAGLVEVDVGLLVRGTIAAAVDQVERLGSVGQRHHQRVVPPHPLVRDIHPLLAPAVGGGEGAVGVDEGLLEEVGGLLLPGPQPGLVEDVHQLTDVALGEPAAEVPGGGRVGDAFGPEGVEVDLVVAPHLQVFQATAPGQEVVGDVQDVVALVVRQVPLEQVKVLIDVPHQPELLRQEVDGPDAAGCDAPDLLGHLVVDVGGGHHRLTPLDAGLILDPAGDPPLASVQLAVDIGVHSKTSWGERPRG